MSCANCTNKSIESSSLYSCICDQFVHPVSLNISAGLNKLPRQIATFHEFRKAMLRDIKTEVVELIDSNNTLISVLPLANWRARDKDDLGIMLLEMWAYICDSLSFYDEVLANEAYIKTSFLKPNLRRLIDLLGYLPSPAVGSMVELAAVAEGRLQLKLPIGTAFRSGAFDGNPPQVFELTNEATIHPFTNQLGIIAPHKGVILNNYPSALLAELKSEIKENDLLLLNNKTDSTQNGGAVVSNIVKYIGVDGRKYNKVNFTTWTLLRQGALLINLQLLKPQLSSGLWTLSQQTESISSNKIVLNILSSQVNPGGFILMVYANDIRWFKVIAIAEVLRSSLPENEIKINGNVYKMPGVSTSVSELTLDVSVNSSLRKKTGAITWDSTKLTGIKVHFGMQSVASIIDEPNNFLTSADPLWLTKPLETPIEDYHPINFLFQDKNTIGVKAKGRVSYDESKITLDSETVWDTPLTLPVNVYGNVITATRGESVKNEKMGSGNASLASQTFKLKKKPLSYYPSVTIANDQSVKNTLTVYVNGILWKEVSTFFGASEYDQVYIVRQNDDEESFITFGDGIRGQRLPTGMDNVICNYRFGAGAAGPPAGSVSQISKPVKGLRSVKNLVAAFGGADAEKTESMREFAPKSALLLGRVVSLQDMQALTASYPGVRAVQVEWRWDIRKLRATAHIFYIGDAGIETGISQRIRNSADPTIPITVKKASSYPLFLSLNIKVNDRYLEKDVLKSLRIALLDSENGLLAPENIGIGTPLFRSRIFESVLNIEGIEAVQSIQIDGENFGDFAILPGTGYFFDIEKGSLTINGINE